MWETYIFDRYLEKMVALLNTKIAQCTRLEGSYHVNLKNITNRSGSIHMTEVDKPILVAKEFN